MDARSPEARIARLEACFGRLDERINGIVEDRKESRVEIQRRLAENNENAKKLMEERARDRAELVTMDLYNSRHQELRTLAEASYRELNQKIDTLAIRLEQKITDHNRDDVKAHEEQDKAIGALNDWVNNQKGRQWALGALTAFIAGIIGVAVQVIFHIFAK